MRIDASLGEAFKLPRLLFGNDDFRSRHGGETSGHFRGRSGEVDQERRHRFLPFLEVVALTQSLSATTQQSGAALRYRKRQVEIPGFGVQLCFQHFVQEMDFTMSSVRKPTQREISDALELSESEVALYVAGVEEKADGVGHWIFFSVSTPNDILFWLRVGNNLTLETDAISILWTKQSPSIAR